MGIRPLPCLPVDSANSCSGQAPKLPSAGEASIVILSLLRPAATPSVRPSATAGFSFGGTSGPHERIMLLDRFTSSATFRPAIAAGTRPNGERTEYRPPIVGTP